MKTYSATFERNGEIISEAHFKANSLKEAKQLAQRHKRLANLVKVKTFVKQTSEL